MGWPWQRKKKLEQPEELQDIVRELLADIGTLRERVALLEGAPVAEKSQRLAELYARFSEQDSRHSQKDQPIAQKPRKTQSSLTADADPAFGHDVNSIEARESALSFAADIPVALHLDAHWLWKQHEVRMGSPLVALALGP
eukprot:1459708-Pleurochrysis_carterae.AAC.1